MTNKNHDIKIVGFGPADLSAVLKPGWNPIVGPNGAGKSNVLAALLWALGGDVPVKLRHKAHEAFVEIDGVRIKTLSKPMLNIGDLELALRDESPIADIILPDVVDPKRGETKRIEALLRLVDVEVDQDAISLLVEEDEGALGYLAEQEPELEKLSIVAAADKIRRRIHEIKRKWETKAAEAQGKINAVRIEKPEEITEVSVEDAQNAYDTAVGDARQIEGSAEQRAAREKQLKEIGDIGERPSLEAVERELAGAREACAEGQERVVELEKELAGARISLEHAQKAVRRLEADLSTVGRAIQEWDARDAILGSRITGATFEDVSKASQRVQEARSALETARLSDEYREACQLVEEAQEEREKCHDRAVRYEKLATSVTGRLSLLLSKAGIDRLTVDEGVLIYVHEDGELEPFTDLSFGERTDAVIDLLARQKVPHDILILPWQFHAALQPEARAEVGQRFAERGICALTEMPDDQEGLRVENAEDIPKEIRINVLKDGTHHATEVRLEGGQVEQEKPKTRRRIK